MKRFEYIRSLEPQQAVMFATPSEASFIAGGTNLLDLMKFEIETPRKLVDITRLKLKQVETTAEGGLRIGTLVTNSDLAAHLAVTSDYPVLSRAMLAGASG
ncbi:FAD binding domain-containing protein, partial [uncultured Psychrobacter sp.]